MDFSQIVGFLITMAAIFYMFIKRAQDLHKRRQSYGDEQEEEEQKGKLQDFLKSLEIDMEESKDFQPPPKPKIPPKPAPVLKQTPQAKHVVHKPIHKEFRSDLDNYQTTTNIDDRKLKINIKNKYEDGYGDHLVRKEFRGEKIPDLIGYKRPSRIKTLIGRLPSKKDILLIHEILDKPKGFKF